MQRRRLHPQFDGSAPSFGDRLNRFADAKRLCEETLTKDSGPLVIALDGGFGSGKTAFLKMCAQHLSVLNPPVPVCYFNAWQQSHTGDPLIDLVAALRQQVQSAGSAPALKRLAQSAGKLLKRAPASALQLAPQLLALLSTGGVLPPELATQLLPGATSLSGTPDTQESPLDGWNDREDQRQAFRKALSAVVPKRGQLIILIDELDRCEPKQAIDIIDTVRHLFDVPGVVVVLGVNQKELQHRIKHLYGQDCDAETHLRRFWDKTVTLRQPSEKDMRAFLESRFESTDLESLFESIQDSFLIIMIHKLVDYKKMSLRDAEQLILPLAASLESVAAVNYSQVLAALILREANREIYEGLIAGEWNVVQAAQDLHKTLNERGRSVAAPDHTDCCMIASLISLDETAIDIGHLVSSKHSIDENALARIQQHLDHVRWETVSHRLTLSSVDNLLNMQ